jgi:hypothetical protein
MHFEILGLTFRVTRLGVDVAERSELAGLFRLVFIRCTLRMGVIAMECKPLYETGNLNDVSVPNEYFDWQSTRRRQLRSGDRPSGGSEVKAARLRTGTR